MFTSLRSRLILSYIVVISVCLLLAGLILVVLLRPFQTRLAYINLVAKVLPTTRLVREYSRQGLTLEEIGTQLKEQAQEDGSRILILTSQGEVVADTEDRLIGQQIRVPTRETRREGQLPYLRGQLVTPDGESIIYVALPTAFLRDPGGASGEQRLMVAVTMTRPRAVNFLGDLLVPLSLAGLVAFVLSILLAYLIARSIAKPLQRVTLATEKMARGDYDQQLSITSPDEVRRLATSFNVMAQEVKASRQAQRDFVANVSHELKTPLTSIQGFSQAILDGTARDAEAQRHAAQIINDEGFQTQSLFLLMEEKKKKELVRKLIKIFDPLDKKIESEFTTTVYIARKRKKR